MSPNSSMLRSRPVIAAAATFVVLSTLLVLASLASFQLLSSVRGFAIAEARWSEAQKRAVLWLYRYADSGDPAHWAAYEEEIAIPVMMRRARLALLTPPIEEDVVHEAMPAGRVPAHLVDPMIDLVRWFGETQFVSEAVRIWSRGDELIADIRALAAQLREQRRRGDTAAMTATLAEINAVDAALSPLEREFSRSVEEAGWLLELALTGILLGLAVLLATGTGLGFWYAGREIHSREQALASSERRYRGLLERLLEVVFETDREGRLTFVSSAWPHIGGSGTSAVLGLSIWELGARVPDGLETDPRAAVMAVLDGRTTTASWEVTLDGSADDEEPRVLEVEVGPAGEPGAITGLVGRLSDVTERRLLRARLAQAGRMEAMGQLAGGIAHDFNNVLTAIIGHAELVQEAHHNRDDAGVDRGVENILSSAETVASLTRQLLTFSRPVQAPELLAPNEAIDRLQILLDRLLPENYQLETELTPDLPPVRLGAAHLDQVIMNLVINARDAMPGGGIIRIRTALVDAHTDPALAESGHSGAFVAFSVIDQGHGMDRRTRERIFEPYFTTKSYRGGSGMGLAIAYGIARDAGGVIEVESEPARGSHFRVLLPAAAGPVSAPPSQRSRPDEVDATTACILVVEDEAGVREVMVQALRREGFAVLSAGGGREALALLDANPDIVLLVTDVVMPDLTGPRLRAAALKRHPGLPTIYVSGYTGDILDVEELGAPEVSFLGKPFLPRDLVLAVHQALATQAHRG